MALDAPEQPIPDPFFTVMELLILLIAPALVLLMIAVHAWASVERRIFGIAAIGFMGIVAGLTSTVHFSVLVLSRHAAFADRAWLLSFTWPSVAYAVDILAWDVFFPLSVLFAAAVFRGSRLATQVRALLVASGGVALVGLAGVAAGDMQIRNIADYRLCGHLPRRCGADGPRVFEKAWRGGFHLGIFGCAAPGAGSGQPLPQLRSGSAAAQKAWRDFRRRRPERRAACLRPGRGLAGNHVRKMNQGTDLRIFSSAG